jgi:hypothetical protein
MIGEQRKTAVFETTLGELIAALIEAASEVSSNSEEIEALANKTLAGMLSTGFSSSDLSHSSLIEKILEYQS